MRKGDNYKNVVYIRPRRTGKTTWLVNKFVSDYETQYKNNKQLPYFICFNYSHMKDIKNIIHCSCPRINSHVIYISNFNYMGCREKPKLFIDEIDMMQRSDLKRLWDCHCPYVSITTPRTLHNRYVVENVREWIRLNRMGYNNILCDHDTMVQRYGDIVTSYSPLIDPDTEIVEWLSEERRMLSESQFKTEYLGQLYI